MSDVKKFKLRSAKLLVEGLLSEAEVVEKIAARLVSGEDEFSLPPYKKWYPISSYPVFYDVLVKKIFKNKYKDQEKGAPAKREAPSETRNQSIFTQDVKNLEREVENNPPQSEKTHQVDLSDLEGVDDLFTEEKPLYDNLVVDGAAEVTSESPLNKPIADLTRTPKTQSKKLKIIALGAACFLMVVFLLPESKNESVKKTPVVAVVLDEDGKAKVRLLIQEATQLCQNGTAPFFRGAEEVYREALALDEANPEVLGGLAESTVYGTEDLTSSQEEDIRKWIQRGRVKEPLNSQFYRVEALLDARKQKWKEAEEKSELAVETDPAGLESLQTKAFVFWQEGKLEELENLLKPLAQKRQWNPFLKYLWLRQEFGKAKFSVVKEEGVKLLELNPLHAPTMILLGKVAKFENRLHDAKKLFENAVGLNQFNDRDSLAEALFELSELQVVLGDKKNSEENLRAALSLKPTLKTKSKVSKISKGELEKYLKSKAYNGEYFAEKSQLAEQQNNFKFALIYLQGGYFLNLKDVAFLSKIAQVSEKLVDSFEDLRIVKNLYQRVIDKDSSQIQAYLSLGLIELDQFNFNQAYALLKKAELIDNRDPQVFIALGKYYYKARDFKQSQLEFEKAFQLDNSNSEILYYAGLLRLYLKRGADKVATELFFRAFAKNPSNYDALVEWLKLKVKNYEKGFALKFIRSLQQKDPKNPHYLWATGEVYAQNSESRRAIEFFHRALDIDNRLSKVRFSLAKSLEAVGELDKAASEYRLASYLERRNGEGFFRAAELFFQIKNYKEAEDILKYLVERYPSYPGAHQYLSRLYKLKQKKDEAIAEMRKEIENNPSNPKFRLELSETLMSYQKWDDAIKELTDLNNNSLFVKGTEFTLDRVRSYLLMSRCYRATEKFENAEGAIRLALEVDANDPELQKELGYIYHELQRDKEAVGAFQNYLNRNPAARDAASIKSLMQRLQIE